MNPLKYIFKLIFAHAAKGFLAELTLIASMFGTAASIDQSRTAARRTRKANKLQQRIADVKAQRERVRAIADARKVRASQAQGAELTGVSGSSGAIAAQSSATSQAASNISFLDQVSSLGKESNMFLNRAATAQSNAGTFSAIAGLSSSVAAKTGAWDKLFNETPQSAGSTGLGKYLQPTDSM